ncbi:FMN-binding protein [Candidatus Saccharibacteria bacterium]|nr:FMN-binding protein [Candidatus Saccharibacteria bacterium]
MNKTFSKIALGSFVVLTFVVYSTHQRNEASQALQRITAAATPKQTTTPAQSNTPISSTPAPTSTPKVSAKFKDGNYTGKSADAFYGFIQVRANIANGRLADVTFLDYPQDRRDSIMINQRAMPVLKSQALQVQSGDVDGVSGATDTSIAFTESLNDALNQARQ